MSRDKSSLDDDLEFGDAGRRVSPLGGGGMTNIGGGTSGAPMGAENTDRTPTNPISDIVGTDTTKDSDVTGGISDRDDSNITDRPRR